MCITIKNDSVCLGNGQVIKMTCFPGLYELFVGHKTGKDTAEIERKGAALLKGGLGNANCTNNLVWSICDWGKPSGNRIRGNLCKYQKDGTYTKEEFAKLIAESAKLLQEGDLKSAIDKIIISIKGLRVSYGSKILRMLSPQQVGVYDKILNDNLSYPFSARGFVDFCTDCKMVANELKIRGIESPHAKLNIEGPRKNGEWFVADVEAAIYHHFILIIEKAKAKAKAETKYA